MIKPKQIVSALILCLLTAVSNSPIAWATVANSSHYGVSEVQFGSGGELHACSATYCAKQSAGELTVGNTKSANYQAQGGLNTEREPFLNVNVSGGSISLGTISPTATATGTATFNVKSYLASGYNVYITGTSLINPTNNYTLPTMSTAAASQQGVAQFGINLRQNSTPVVGSDIVQVPSSSFSFGAAAAGYNTANIYKYVTGDIIASSSSSSGETDYTMSMIANAATTSPGGRYAGRLAINVVPTF